MRRIVNLTTHPITFYTSEGEITIPSSGVARVELERAVEEYVMVGVTPVPVNSVTPRGLIGLPPFDGETIYVVSSIVERYANRSDLVTVDRLRRTNAGVVLGAESLSRSA